MNLLTSQPCTQARQDTTILLQRSKPLFTLLWKQKECFPVCKCKQLQKRQGRMRWHCKYIMLVSDGVGYQAVGFYFWDGWTHWTLLWQPVSASYSLCFLSLSFSASPNVPHLLFSPLYHSLLTLTLSAWTGHLQISYVSENSCLKSLQEVTSSPFPPTALDKNIQTVIWRCVISFDMNHNGTMFI